MATTAFNLLLLADTGQLAWAGAWPPYGGGTDLGRDPKAASPPAGSALAPIIVPDAVPGSAVKQQYLYDFYYHIWVLPQRLELRNPQVKVDIPFAMWNAFPHANTLEGIGGSGIDGLTLDVTPPDPFGAYEYRVVNIQILPTAPLEIDATYVFEFTEGAAIFRFIAPRATILAIMPDVPVVETWEWLTDVHVAADGTEQRIALRGSPRRGAQYKLLLTDEQDIRDNFTRLLIDAAGQLVIPYFAYATLIKTPSARGGTEIFFDLSRTDVRAGESAVILTRDGKPWLVKLKELTSTGAILDAQLDTDVAVGDYLVPAFPSLIENRPTLARRAVHDVAEVSLVTQVTSSRETFSRPGSPTVLPYFDGLPILERRPLAESAVPDAFDTGVQMLDFDTGTIESWQEWKHTQVEAARLYKIPRIAKPAEMDWWRDFLGYAQGRRNPFLVPTYRRDVLLAEQPIAGTSRLVLKGSVYGGMYFPLAPFKRLRLWTAAGPLNVIVQSVSVDDNGNDVCVLTEGLPREDAWVQIDHISFLLKVRLASDIAQLEHYAFETFLNLAFRTTDA